MEICPCSNKIELIFSVNYEHFSRPKKMREKLRRFVRNYGEMCGNLFITQSPGNDHGADVGFQASPGKKDKRKS